MAKRKVATEMMTVTTMTATKRRNDDDEETSYKTTTTTKMTEDGRKGKQTGEKNMSPGPKDQKETVDTR